MGEKSTNYFMPALPAPRQVLNTQTCKLWKYMHQMHTYHLCKVLEDRAPWYTAGRNRETSFANGVAVPSWAGLPLTVWTVLIVNKNRLEFYIVATHDGARLFVIVLNKAHLYPSDNYTLINKSVSHHEPGNKGPLYDQAPIAKRWYIEFIHVDFCSWRSRWSTLRRWASCVVLCLVHVQLHTPCIIKVCSCFPRCWSR